MAQAMAQAMARAMAQEQQAREGKELVLVFGPPRRDLGPELIKMVRRKIAAERPDVRVQERWGPECTALVASPYSTPADLQELVGETPLADVCVVPFEFARLLATGKNPDLDQARREMAREQTKARETLEREEQERKESQDSFDAFSQRQRDKQRRSAAAAEGGARETAELLRRVPKEFRKQCERFLGQAKALGIELPERLFAKQSSPRKRPDMRESYMAFKAGVQGLAKPNKNTKITHELERLATFNKSTKEEWRAKSYRHAIDIIRSLDFEVTDSNQIKTYRGLGPSILRKVDEIIRTGRCMQADTLTQSERAQALESLTKVHGIGTETALQLYDQGIRSVADLRKPEVYKTLNHDQKIGVTYFEDFLPKMPRQEAGAIGQRVIDATRRVWPKVAITAEIAGSYRRGAEECGDVDVILTTPEMPGCPLLKDLIDALHEEGLLVEDLTRLKADAPKKRDRHGQVAEKQSYMGVCRLSPGQTARRLDIKIYPRDSFAFALLYFTGNEHYNRSLRHYCKKQGWSLSDDGLYEAVRVGGSKVAKSSTRIKKCRTEQEIVEFLGFPYKEPWERNRSDQEVLAATDTNKPKNGWT